MHHVERCGHGTNLERRTPYEKQMDMSTYYQKVLLAWMLWEKVFPRRRRSRGRQEMDMIGWLELSWCRKWIWLVDWSCRDRDKAIVRGGMVYGLCKWWPFHHTIFGPHTLNRLITISPWTWHELCEWPHESQMDMVTSFLRGFSLWLLWLRRFLPWARMHRVMIRRPWRHHQGSRESNSGGDVCNIFGWCR